MYFEGFGLGMEVGDRRAEEKNVYIRVIVLEDSSGDDSLEDLIAEDPPPDAANHGQCVLCQSDLTLHESLHSRCDLTIATEMLLAYTKPL